MEQDQKSVEDRKDGGCERGDNVAQRAHAAEEADDAKGSKGTEDINGHRDRAEGDERQGYNEGVEYVPAVAHEAAKPVGIGVDEELRRKNECKGGVKQFQPASQGCFFAVAIDKRGDELGFGIIDQKVLTYSRKNVVMHCDT